MFMGVNSFRSAGRCDSYAGALAIFEASQLTPTGKRRTAKSRGYNEPAAFPLGLTKRGQTCVRQLSDGSIALRLYSTDVVTWHPDNSVSVENFGSVTTSAFAGAFLPWGVSLRHPSRNGGDEGITYSPDSKAGWRERRICFGHVVRFVEVSDPAASTVDGRTWVPDEATLRDIRLPALDRKAAREVTRGIPFADFENYLSMAPRHTRIEHDTVDIDGCLDALRARDFRRATELLPLIEEPSGFGLDRVIRACALPVVVNRRDQHVTMGSIRKLRLAIFDAEGCYDTDVAKTVPLAHYERRIRLGRQLDGYYRWGCRMTDDTMARGGLTLTAGAPLKTTVGLRLGDVVQVAVELKDKIDGKAFWWRSFRAVMQLRGTRYATLLTLKMRPDFDRDVREVDFEKDVVTFVPEPTWPQGVAAMHMKLVAQGVIQLGGDT